MIKLNFTMSELLHSNIAEKYNIYNIPDKEHLDNLLILICECLQPLRNFIGKPIIITSGYRNPRLNSHPLINGAPNSQHTTGQAVDFTIKGMTPKQIIEMIKRSGIEFDQVIDELTWVHISYNKKFNRNESLSYRDGKYFKL
jgi:D-alanyl-D-alanine dipeptidase